MQIIDKAISELIPYANNARTHSDEQILQIAASIKEFGFTNPVLLDGENGIIAGHGRVMAAKKLGMDTLPCIELKNLSQVQKKAYILADNKLALNAGWDDALLAIEFEELKEIDFDLDLTGFDLDEIDALMPEEIPAGLTDEDEVPDPPVQPVTKLGDVWLCDKHRVMCGDSTSIDAVEKLIDGKKADMVFTDPPYGVDYDGGHAVKGKRREKLKNDGDPNIYDSVMPVVYSASKGGAAVYLWFSDSKSTAVSAAVSAAGYEIRNTLIWNKNVAQFGAIGAQYKSKHEPCLYCFKKGNAPYWAGPNNEVSVWDVKRCSKNEFHPTQKPVELGERALNNSSKSGDAVLDLFGGSGSTLIACEKTNRTNYSMELDEHYVDVIVKRWQNYTGKIATLESTGELFNDLAVQ